MTKGKARKWTEEQIAIVREFMDSETTSQIAKRLNLKPAAAYSLIYKLRNGPPDYCDRQEFPDFLVAGADGACQPYVAAQAGSEVEASHHAKALHSTRRKAAVYVRLDVLGPAVGS